MDVANMFFAVHVRVLVDTNLSAGRAPRASFITLMTSSPTCLPISGLTSAKTSCEFSNKLLGLSLINLGVTCSYW